MAARIHELNATRGELKGKLNELLQAARTDHRALTEAETSSADQLQADLDRVLATIKHEEHLLAYERDDAPAVPQPAAPDADKNPWGDVSTEYGYAAAFGTFLKAVADTANGYVDPRLLTPRAAASGLNTSVPADAGYLVRTDFSDRLLKRGMEEAVLAPRCTTIDIGEGADGIELPYLDETSRANGSRWGGVQVYRRAEADTVTASKPKFGRLEIRLEDLMGICYATDRSLQDAVSLAQVIEASFGSEFAFKIDDEIIRGTGVGQCLGVLNSGALVSVAKETSQAAATVVARNVIKMRSRLSVRSRGESAWFMNPDVEAQLPLMVVEVKNVAGTENVGGAPVYMPANGLAGQQFDTLFGKPVIPIEQAEAIGTQGDIFYMDLSEYILIRKGAMQTAQSMHVRFIYGENTFRFTYRINGAPAWKTALTPYKGTNTTSPYVTLDTRG